MVFCLSPPPFISSWLDIGHSSLYFLTQVLFLCFIISFMHQNSLWLSLQNDALAARWAVFAASDGFLIKVEICGVVHACPLMHIRVSCMPPYAHQGPLNRYHTQSSVPGSVKCFYVMLLCFMYILYSFHFFSIKIPLEDGDVYNRFIITIKIYAYWILKEVIQASVSRRQSLKVSF